MNFTIGRHGAIHLVRSKLTVPSGSSLVFWPGNAVTARRVNSGNLSLYGGGFGTGFPKGQVPLANVDNLPHWTYKFSSPGTYYQNRA